MKAEIEGLIERLEKEQLELVMIARALTASGERGAALSYLSEVIGMRRAITPLRALLRTLETPND